MALCESGGQLVFFGGVGAAGTESILDVADDAWAFDPSLLRWERIQRQSPWPSARRCVGFASAGARIHLWGGSGLSAEGDKPARYNFLNDWWRLDVGTGRWELLRPTDDHRLSPIEGSETDPAPRYTPVFQAVSDRFFLFGGYTEDRLGKRKLNDAWVHEGGVWRPVPIDGPAGYSTGSRWPGLRYGCMSAVVDDTVFVFGGFSDDGDHNDLWSFNLRERAWTLLKPDSSDTRDPSPTPRYCGALAYFGDRLFLFGGRSRRHAKLNFNDLWVFDLPKGRWTMISDNRGPHEYGEAAAFPAYHAKSSSAVLDQDWYVWGGEGTHGHVSDFWRYSFPRATWELISAARPDDPLFW